MGKAVGKVLGTVTGTLTKGPLGDSLFGEKDPGVAASTANIYNSDQQKLLDNTTNQYQDLLNKNSQIAQNQGAQMENQILANADDQERKAQQIVAQRGLGNSSVGLNAILGAKKNTSDQIAGVRAGLPGMQLDNLNKINSGIGNLLGTQSGGTIYNKAQASTGRDGGLAPLLVAGGKAYASGGAG